MFSEEKNLKQLEKRFLELDQKAFQKQIPMFSHFLNLYKYQTFLSMKNGFFCPVRVWGGYEGAERVLVIFQPDSYCDGPAMPVQCIKIVPVSIKFAEALTHRDYLGAILNLGIDRNALGDIVVGEKEAYLFCHKKIVPFLISECKRIKHTPVKVFLAEFQNSVKEGEKREVHGTVASLRIDSFLSVALGESRSRCIYYIKEERVFCNHKRILSAKFVLKPGDMVTVRGVGRFQLKDDEIRKTKKGRYHIHILIQ